MGINRAGKFGTILAHFGTKTFSAIYMRVEINWAGKFGTILARFGTKTFSAIYIHTRGNKSGRQIWDNFDTFWYVRSLCKFSQMPLVACSAPRSNSKILNFLNNHFGHLTS